MKVRNGWVSNSSSSSFIVALKKGHSLDELLENVGVFKDFAQSVLDFIGNQMSYLEKDLQSAQNIRLYELSKYYNPDDAKEIYDKGTEFKWLEDWCLSTVDNVDEWFFVKLRASYNEGENPIEHLIGNGYLNIKTDFFILESE